MSLLRLLGEPEFKLRQPVVYRDVWAGSLYRRTFRWRTRAVALALVIGLAGGSAVAWRADQAPVISIPAVPPIGPPSSSPGWTPSPQAAATASPSPRSTVSPAVAPRPVGSLSGTATWYCLAGRSACTRDQPGGLYAAAGPALRAALGDWRGRQVTVSAGGRSVRVTLIDSMSHSGRLIDLYADAFAQLAPLSRGVLGVEVTW